MVGGKQFSTLKPTRVDIFDVSSQLRDISEAAIAVTTNGTPTTALNWSKRLDYKAIIDYVAFSGYVAGVDEWTITIEGAESPTGTFVTLGSVVLDNVGTRKEVPLSGEQFLQVVPNITEAAIRVTATLSGAAGALTYGAFLTRT